MPKVNFGKPTEPSRELTPKLTARDRTVQLPMGAAAVAGPAVAASTGGCAGERYLLTDFRLVRLDAR